VRILLINPNTSTAMTETVAARMRAVAGPDVTILPVTGRFGARYIASRAAAAIAGHAALDALAEHVLDCDAVYLACFGDPGLAALKEVSPAPVVGMAEASMRAACGLGRRFAIVTGGAAWGPMLTELVAGFGLSGRVAAIRTIEPSGGEIARDPAAALGRLAEACNACVDDGADAVILGGAGLAGLATAIQGSVRVPVICSVDAGARAVLAAGRQGPSPVKQESAGALLSVDSAGLAPALTKLLRGAQRPGDASPR
jgi:Asp/Glu/hydantoin racemase